LLHASRQAETNFYVDPDDPPAAYAASARAAFSGLPSFALPAERPTRIVRHPGQWSLRQRRQRRLVIKEINPFACEWLLKTYSPRVIYLVRHPAAVALSNARLGFMQGNEIWREQGLHQGRAHAMVGVAWRRPATTAMPGMKICAMSPRHGSANCLISLDCIGTPLSKDMLKPTARKGIALARGALRATARP
jgi:hypothetical protein